jgi:hypothetical protein
MQVKIEAGGNIFDFFDDAPVILGGSHNAAFADPSFANFKLWLDERNHFSAWLKQYFHGREYQFKRDKRDVDCGKTYTGWKSANLEKTNVGSFENNDARMVSQLPIQLAVAHIHRIDSRGAMLQQAIGKSAGGRADVKGDFTIDVDLKFLKRFCQLVSATAGIGRGSGSKSYHRAGINETSHFRNWLIIDQYLTGQHPRPSRFAACYQASRHQ